MFYPSVSVVIPLHNYEDFIKESINSVLSQTMSDFELIIVNDRSTDNSGEIAHSYLDPRIKVIDFPEHRGCYPARNAGMRVASGKYICVMDADDICLPKRLEKQYKFMEENLKIGLIGGDYRTMSSCLHIHTETNSETIKLMLLRSCALHHPTCMIRSSLLKKHNLY
jgi:glycosyltransferase involved in cell wall biosynthesis